MLKGFFKRKNDNCRNTLEINKPQKLKQVQKDDFLHLQHNLRG